jgi:hypothetical protein
MLRSRMSHPRRRAPLVMAAIGATALVGGVASISSAAAGPAEHKVTLCHATASRTNPYVEIRVDYHSIIKSGHGGHDGPVFAPDVEGPWGDVIPAFDLGDGASYPGLNLEDGQDLLAHGCSVGGTTTTTVETTTTLQT